MFLVIVTNSCYQATNTLKHLCLVEIATISPGTNTSSTALAYTSSTNL